MIRATIGRRYIVRLPWSEVCMHMRVHDKLMIAHLISPRAVQLYTLDGEPFSAPILTGEAGFYHDSEGFYLSPMGDLEVREIED